MPTTNTLPARPEIDDLMWLAAQELPCEFTVEVPVPGFKVRNLLNLVAGTVLETAWNETTDVPLRMNGCLFGRGVFEVVGDRLAVRVTDLA